MRVILRLALLLVLAVPAWAAELPDPSGLAFHQHPGAAIPLDTVFTDSFGHATTLRALTGGLPSVLLLGYFHCPSLCGVVRDDAFTALAGVGLRTPDEYRVLDISIDPAEQPADAAQARADDLQRFPTPGAAKGWHFLTGTAPAIAAVADAAGFRARWDDQLKQFLHPAGMVVLTPGGTIASYALGVGYPAAALRESLLNARHGDISPPASPILLLCYHFDSSTGRYSLAVMKVLRLACGAVVVAIGALVLALRYRGRHRLA